MDVVVYDVLSPACVYLYFYRQLWHTAFHFEQRILCPWSVCCGMCRISWLDDIPLRWTILGAEFLPTIAMLDVAFILSNTMKTPNLKIQTFLIWEWMQICSWYMRILKIECISYMLLNLESSLDLNLPTKLCGQIWHNICAKLHQFHPMHHFWSACRLASPYYL